MKSLKNAKIPEREHEKPSKEPEVMHKLYVTSISPRPMIFLINQTSYKAGLSDLRVLLNPLEQNHLIDNLPTSVFEHCVEFLQKKPELIITTEPLSSRDASILASKKALELDAEADRIRDRIFKENKKLKRFEQVKILSPEELQNIEQQNEKS